MTPNGNDVRDTIDGKVEDVVLCAVSVIIYKLRVNIVVYTHRCLSYFCHKYYVYYMHGRYYVVVETLHTMVT